MKNLNLFLVFVCSIVFAGCSAKQNDVPNHPPVIPDSISSFENEYGTLSPGGITFFLWPEFATEIEGANLIAKVKKASNTMDRLSGEMTTLISEEKQKKDDFFGSMKCLEYADLEGEDPDMIEWVNNWKAPENEVAKQVINTCVSNQESRRTLSSRIDSTRTRQGLAANEVYTTLEPGYPEKLVGNLKQVFDQRGSSVVLEQTESGVRAIVRFYGFEFEGNNQSSVEGESTLAHAQIQSVTYDPKKKSLFFTVPQVTQNPETKEFSMTGKAYVFQLFRGQNFLGFAKFAGDMALVSSEGKILRTGSASLYGTIQ